MDSESDNDLLVAYDDTEASRRAATFAAKRAAKTGETVDVVHVGRDLSEDDIERAVGEAFDNRDVVASYWVDRIGGSEDENTSVRLRLSQLINDHGYSMVFVGNEKHGFLTELAEASISEALIENQNVPVVLVPPA